MESEIFIELFVAIENEPLAKCNSTSSGRENLIRLLKSE